MIVNDIEENINETYGEKIFIDDVKKELCNMDEDRCCPIMIGNILK
jgi:hypothetical protein